MRTWLRQQIEPYYIETLEKWGTVRLGGEEKSVKKTHTSYFEGEADAADLYELFGRKAAGLEVTVCQYSVVTTRLQLGESVTLTAWLVIINPEQRNNPQTSLHNQYGCASLTI